MRYLNLKKLPILAEEYQEKYKDNLPFPHIVIDDFLDNPGEICDVFPDTGNFSFYEYKSPFENKLAFDQVAKFPKAIADLLAEMSAPEFLAFLEKLTGIDGLIPDPYYRGGGVHQSQRGGKLDVHIDFNIHPKLKLMRRLNVIIYLNKNWQESWHGDLQLWEGRNDNGKHELIRLHHRIYPVYNRLLIFSTTEKSYHGHPEPLDCPEGVTRNSIALYFYTADKPADGVDQHSTTYVKLPGEDDTLDELRKKRNEGRLNTTMAGKPPDH
ncbi:unnamed protein product [Sphagnum jensenii]|jgi:Rps23 Pro-64 3,4-dihydroxylase Tpa1-like proline 4-hydroxylase|uniref:Prolyl 4-hydroxylase alpha subunit Fe(2+) 2OG dioxygenase domain-containing protein n=1 Tax=Sphagnum jensenii TaxID=128206 RepID=A0ABP0V7B3_9BRYO